MGYRPERTSREAGWQIAECLLPGLTPAIARSLAERLRAELARSDDGGQVTFLGSLLMPEDEVLMCLFTGPQAEVRALSERAELPFERILRCVGLDWQMPESEKGTCA